MKQEQEQRQIQTLVKIDLGEYLKNPYIKALIIAMVVLTVVSVVGTIYILFWLSKGLFILVAKFASPVNQIIVEKFKTEFFRTK